MEIKAVIETIGTSSMKDCWGHCPLCIFIAGICKMVSSKFVSPINNLINR